jgi:hypothetical protein
MPMTNRMTNPYVRAQEPGARNLADAPDTEDQLGLRSTSNMTRQEVEAKREQFRVRDRAGWALHNPE